MSSVTVPLSLKQNCVFTLVITSGYTDPHTAHSTHRRQCNWWCAACGNPRLAEDACLFQTPTGARKSTCVQVINFFSFVCGARNHAETRTGAYIYYGDAASFHEWEFRTRPCIVGKFGDQYIEAMCKVCDGVRGDAFVAAQEVGFDNLCEINDGRPCGFDTLTNRMRGTVFPLTEHESKESFRQYCLPRGPLYRQNGESMKQCVSRRRRCWTLLTQMDPVIHLSGGHRSDMLLT